MKTLIAALLITTAASAQTIPGIMPVDVYLNLEEQGFTTEKTFLGTGSRFVCRMSDGGVDYSVTIHMPAGNVNVVSRVSAVALNTDAPESQTNTRAANFLSWLGTLPFDGNSPATTTGWIKQNIGGGRATFGEVDFAIHAKARAVVMEIAPKGMNAAAASAEAAPKWKPAQLAERVELRPKIGDDFQRVLATSGEPAVRDNASGWAWWRTFKARFEAGRVVEVADKKKLEGF